MPTSPTGQPTRIRVFVDYWNFQLTLNGREAALQGLCDYRFSVDWVALGRWLADKGKGVLGVNQIDYGGCHIYASYNPKTTEGTRFHRWMTTFLNRQPGVMAQCIKRSPRSLPHCPSCHQPITHCPHQNCGAPIISTIEKGVDTRVVTDMISLAWQDAYDVAVLASLDADLIPAVELLQLRAKRVIQAGFPPAGAALATACWASFDVFQDRAAIRRT